MSATEIYWNSIKKCFSVRQGGKVIAHAKAFLMMGCDLPVSAKARDRIINTRKKEVHALIRGTVVRYDDFDGNTVRDESIILPVFCCNERVIAYNPYKHSSFVTIPTQEPIHHAAWIGGCVSQGRPFVRAWDEI